MSHKTTARYTIALALILVAQALAGSLGLGGNTALAWFWDEPTAPQCCLISGRAHVNHPVPERRSDNTNAPESAHTNSLNASRCAARTGLPTALIEVVGSMISHKPHPLPAR